jgi:hypothetical protein
VEDDVWTPCRDTALTASQWESNPRLLISQSGALPLTLGPAARHEPRRTCQFYPRLWGALANLARPGSPRLHPGDRGRFGAVPVSYRVRTCNAQICSLAANVTSFSDLFSLVTVTPTDVLKIRTVSVRVRLGALDEACPHRAFAR